MAETNYAFVKNGEVTNIAVFDNPSEELLAHFKNEFALDHIVSAHEQPKAAIGGTWDGTKFTLPKPYPSWELNVDGDWEAPVAYPTDGKTYSWDEASTSWVKVQPYPSWVLNADNDWEAPVAYPDDEKDYTWDEASTSWVEVPSGE